MRQFDLEVDVVNEHSFRYVAEFNALTRKEYLLTDELAKVSHVIVFVSTYCVCAYYVVLRRAGVSSQYYYEHTT